MRAIRVVTLAILLGAGLLPGCERPAPGLDAPAAAARPRLALEDLDGRPVDPLAGDPAATVALFTRSDCPISNRYAPEVNRLAERFVPRGVAFWLVYVDPAEPPAAIRRHLAAYGYARAHAARDVRHALVRATGASVTPEAALFARDGRLVYRGRVDDRFPAYGKARAAAGRHDLERALEDTLAGRPVEVATTPAVGCLIGDLR